MSKAVGATGAVIGYTRVSTDKQELSPATQRAELERWCESHGRELVAVHSDEVSGGASLDKRPGLLAAVDSLRRGGVLLVAKRDRLARDPLVSAMVERLAERKGASIVSAAGEGSGDNPADVLMRRIVDAFAEYERRIIGARTKAALAVKKAKGEKTGGDVPFGYQLAAIDGRTLVPHPAEQRVMALVAELRATGLSYRGIARELNRAGYNTKRGSQWTHKQVARVDSATGAAA